MLSRTAENIYWMARYLERAENTARLVSVCSETRLDHPDPAGLVWERVLSITGTLDGFKARGGLPTEEEVADFLLGDPQSPASLLSICARARENSRTLIEVLPRESWEEVNALHQLAAQLGAATTWRRDEHLREIIRRAQAMAGLFLGALNDDEAYAFLRLGRAIERADFADRVMLGHFEIIEDEARDHQSLRGADWVSVLRSLTAFQMYRRSVQGPVTGPRVVRFLTRSTVFPRAIAFCAREAEQALKRLPVPGPVVAAAAHLSATLAAEPHPTGNGPKPTAVLLAVQDHLSALHEAIAAACFVPHPHAAARASQTQVQST